MGVNVMSTAPIALSEADWSRRVVDTALLFGWRYAHARPARTSKGWRTAYSGHGGFPDLVLLRPPRLLVVELKRDGARPTDEQSEWLRQFAAVPCVESYTWTPSDWKAVYLCLAKESLA